MTNMPGDYMYKCNQKRTLQATTIIVTNVYNAYMYCNKHKENLRRVANVPLNLIRPGGHCKGYKTEASSLLLAPSLRAGSLVGSRPRAAKPQK